MSQDQNPSKESLREVKREYKQRQKDEKARKKAADKYWAEQANPGASLRPSKVTSRVQITLAVVAIASVGLVAFGALRGSTTSPSALPRTGNVQPSAEPSPSGTEASSSSSPAPCKFCGTKAEHWAVGAHGLGAPKAVRVGNFGPHQVSDAYSKVIEYLKAATLDPAVVFHSKLKPVFATLGSETTAWVHKQHDLAKSTKGKKGIYWADLANRFHPGDWDPEGEIRVRNKFKAERGDNNGELKIHFVNVTAYWLTPHVGVTPQAVIVRRTGDVYFYEDGSSKVSMPNYGGSGYASSAGVCGAIWPEVEYIDAWPNPASAKIVSDPPIAGPWDMSDPDAEPPTAPGCFTDTSGIST